MVTKVNITTDELRKRQKRLDTMRAFQQPDRVPMMSYVDIFQYLAREKIECEDYLNDVQLHLNVHMGYQKMLLEEYATDQSSFNPGLDFFVNSAAQAFGGEIEYIPGSLPFVKPWIHDEKDLLKLEKLDVKNNGFFQKEKEWRTYAYDHRKEYAVEFADGNIIYPMENMIHQGGVGCCGIFSTAQMIMSMDELFIAAIEDPDFVHRLLEIITQKYIERWEDLCSFFGAPSAESMYITDDTAVYLSPEMFSEFCVPYMKRLRETFPQANTSFHLCDTAFPYLDIFADQVKIDGFVGFKPSKNKSVRETFLPVAQKYGGKIRLEPDTDPCMVNSKSLAEVYDEVWEILSTFENCPGLMLSFSTWSPEKSFVGRKACEDFAEGVRRGV